MNKWKSGIMGVVIGDALGCPVQFESREEVSKHPVTGMRGYGTFNLPAGSWTDDSSLTLALLESIRRTGTIDYKDIMDNFVKWLDDGAFTPYGYAYDIGRGTINAIHRYKRYHKPLKAGNIDERFNGNGSLMRIMPAVLYCIQHHLSDSEAIDIIPQGRQSDPCSHPVQCRLWTLLLHGLAILNEEGSLTSRLQAGLDKGFAFYDAYLADHENLSYYDRLRNLDSFGDLPEDSIRSTGYVVDTLEAAVWSLINTDSFADALLKAVNLGYDTDTVGAVCGGLAALYYGYDAIPQDWLAALQRLDWIESLCTDGNV